MQLWEISYEDASLENILSWAMRSGANRLLLSIRGELTKSDKLIPVLPNIDEWIREKFIADEIKVTIASAWPGTILSNGSAFIYLIPLNQNTIDDIVRCCPRLDKWTHNNGLPEDICAFKIGEKYPFFITVTHEADGWILARNTPDLDCLYEANYSLEEFMQYIPNGDNFLLEPRNVRKSSVKKAKAIPEKPGRNRD